MPHAAQAVAPPPCHPPALPALAECRSWPAPTQQDAGPSETWGGTRCSLACAACWPTLGPPAGARCRGKDPLLAWHHQSVEGLLAFAMCIINVPTLPPPCFALPCLAAMLVCRQGGCSSCELFTRCVRCTATAAAQWLAMLSLPITTASPSAPLPAPPASAHACAPLQLNLCMAPPRPPPPPPRPPPPPPGEPGEPPQYYYDL